MGYSLNQRGLSTCVIRGEKGQKLTEGEIVASRSEQEIFDVLGIRWRLVLFLSGWYTKLLGLGYCIGPVCVGVRLTL